MQAESSLWHLDGPHYSQDTWGGDGGIGKDKDSVRAELEHRLDRSNAWIHSRSTRGDSLLHFAAGLRDPDCIRLILDHDRAGYLSSVQNLNPVCGEHPLHRILGQGETQPGFS